MRKKYFNLQFFAEGGAGAASTGAEGAAGQAEGLNAGATDGRTGNQDDAGTSQDATTPEDTEKAFEELIKGDYRDAYRKRTEGIVKDRLKKSNETISNLQKQYDALTPIMGELAMRYGLEADDVEGLVRAVQQDNALLEDEAARHGMSVDQLREVNRVKLENKKLTEAMEQLEKKKEGEQIYAQWTQQADALRQKYNMDFNLNEELANPDFTAILKVGGSIEAAYMATHHDEIMTYGMAQAAETAKNNVVKSINSKSGRPIEGAASSGSQGTVKVDVRKLTPEQMREYEKKVLKGERVSFS